MVLRYNWGRILSSSPDGRHEEASALDEAEERGIEKGVVKGEQRELKKKTGRFPIMAWRTPRIVAPSREKTQILISLTGSAPSR